MRMQERGSGELNNDHLLDTNLAGLDQRMNTKKGHQGTECDMILALLPPTVVPFYLMYNLMQLQTASVISSTFEDCDTVS